MHDDEVGAGMITKIEHKKRSRYDIYLDDELACNVHEDILIKYRLAKGQELDEGLVKELREAESHHAAYSTALRYVGRGPKSAKEVRERVKRDGHNEAIIQKVLEQLIEQGYLNDGQFAQQWTEHRMVSQKKGRLLIRQELQHKGVNKTLIEQALNEIDAEDEFQTAIRLAKKKWEASSEENHVKRRKIMAFLLRRGYSQGIVKKAIAQINHGKEDEDEDLDLYNPIND